MDRPIRQAHPMTMNEKAGYPSNPTGASEARIVKVVHGQRTLRSPQDCDLCKYAMEHRSEPVPYHDASERCESGKREHCSCDTCF
jgi:hypothetical protein